jgi:ankyrin repeat protein
MPVPKVFFQVHGSPDLKRLRHLEALRQHLTAVLDNTQNLYVYQPPSTLPPLTVAEYQDAQARYADEYDDAEYQQLHQTEAQLLNQGRADYLQLKQQLLADARASGDDHPQRGNPPQFDFDDANMVIDVGYDFKNCMDRLTGPTKNLIKRMTVPDPNNDTRPFQDLFRDELATPKVKQQYDDKYGEVLDDFRAQGPQVYQDPPNEPDLTGAQNGTDCVNAICNTQPGMCLSDLHGNADSKNFLADNMAALKQNGVNTLFIEHFWQEQQGLLDEYLGSPPDTPLPPALETAITKLEAPDSFRRMLAEAKQHQVRIVGLDSFDAKVPQDGDARNPDQRAARFNAIAAEVVNREKGAGKFVLMAGEDHINTHFSGAPGLAQLLGVPGVKTAPGGKLERLPEDKTKRGLRGEAEQAYYDAFIEHFQAKQPNLFVPANRGDATAYNNLEPRRNALREAANKLARENAAQLGRLKPDAIQRLAQQAADRAFPNFAPGGNVQIDPTNPGGAIIADAQAMPPQTTQDVANLKAAIQARQTNQILQLLQANPDDRLLVEAGTDGASLLHIAAVAGDTALIQALLARGVDPNCRDAQGNTPLHALSTANTQPNHAQAVDALVQGGARLDITNGQEDTPAHIALRNGRADLLARYNTNPEYGAATVPRKPLHLITAVKTGDVAAINALPPTSPLLTDPNRASQLIHEAARARQEGALRALAAKNIDLKALDADGNTILHTALKDDSAVPQSLVTYVMGQLGDDAYKANNKGETALHLAAGWGHVQVTAQLLQDPKLGQLNIPDNGGLTPLQHSTASNLGKNTEQEFYKHDPNLDVKDYPGVPSTVDMLTWITVAKNPKYLADQGVTIRQFYQELYDNPLLRPVLEVAAKDGFGGRHNRPPNNDEAFRIFFNDSAGAAGLAGSGGGLGHYDTDGNRLIVGGQQDFTSPDGKGAWLDSVKGTLIHELTHHAAQSVFHNDDLPVPQNDAQASQDYITAFEQDVKANAHLAVTDEEQKLVQFISGRLGSYAKPLTVGTRNYAPTETMQLEMIVGVSQAIAQFGEPLVRKLYPNFTQYYQNTFGQKCQDACTNDPVLGAKDLDAAGDALGRPTPPNLPDKMFTPGADITADKLWEMIKKDFTIAKDQLDPLKVGIPVYSAECYTLSQADAQELQRLEAVIKKQLKKALEAGEVPPQISTESLRQLVKGVSQACASGVSDKALLKAVDVCGKTFADTAAQDFDNDYLKSAQACLDRKLTKGYKLTNRDIAELILVRAAERAAGTTVQAGGLNVNPDKYKKFIASMTRQLGELDPTQLADIDGLVNAGVDRLIRDKDFTVKSKAKKSGTGHVSIKGDLDKKWLKKLLVVPT